MALSHEELFVLRFRCAFLVAGFLLGIYWTLCLGRWIFAAYCALNIMAFVIHGICPERRMGLRLFLGGGIGMIIYLAVRKSLLPF